VFLTAIERRKDAPDPNTDGFPWSLPIVQGLRGLQFDAPVTFLIGENGSGKSTLLEALAAGTNAIAAGSDDIARDPSLAAGRELARALRFSFRRHPRTRLFLRAEDVFGYVKRLAREMTEIRGIAHHFDEELADGWGKQRALGAINGQLRALTGKYGDNPDGQSHGETFLALLTRRLTPHGLYFLDEPETPLSPLRVLGLLSLLKQSVANDCQFVIATHSPLLMALPGAQLLLFAEGEVVPVAFADVEHVRLTRDFLNNPESFLRHL
jgi:predicted ATPase